jgi:hypothetical protein
LEPKIEMRETDVRNAVHEDVYIQRMVMNKLQGDNGFGNDSLHS